MNEINLTNERNSVQSSEQQGFQERLKQVVKSIGGNSALARLTGWSETAIRKWVKGESEPTASAILSIAKASDVSVEWLLTGIEVGDSQMNETDIKELARKLLDIPGSAWNRIEHEVWEIQEPNMEPTMNVGEGIVVNLSAATKPIVNGVYLVDVGGNPKVMRLQAVPDGIAFSNDNPIYKSSDFSIELVDIGNKVKIIGRVLRSGKSRKPVE